MTSIIFFIMLSSRDSYKLMPLYFKKTFNDIISNEQHLHVQYKRELDLTELDVMKPNP